jgi:diguanylate cyclase (GGDEF)-like protein
MQSLNILHNYNTDNNSINLFNMVELPAANIGNMLLEQLQTTLEIDRLLDIFAMEASKFLDLIGLSFSSSEYSGKIRGSRTGKFQQDFSISVEGQHLGKLNYSSNQKINNRTNYTLSHLHQILAYPLRNALKYHQAIKLASQDSLTGLGNRRTFDLALAKAASNAKRKNWVSSLLLIDLDKFKPVNDTFGHHIGDQVLQEFAKCLQASVRDSDSCFRLGGDEFAIIAEDSSSEMKEVFYKRLQLKIKENALLTHYQVSCSVGSAILTENEDLTAIYIRADNQLYQHKANSKTLA